MSARNPGPPRDDLWRERVLSAIPYDPDPLSVRDDELIALTRGIHPETRHPLPEPFFIDFPRRRTYGLPVVLAALLAGIVAGLLLARVGVGW